MRTSAHVRVGTTKFRRQNYVKALLAFRCLCDVQEQQRGGGLTVCVVRDNPGREAEGVG